MTLPRKFWCHAALETSAPRVALFDGYISVAPEDAVHWVRESVRDISPSLDRSAFHGVWGWLGNHRAVQAAVTALHHGEPFGFTVDAPAGRRTWTVHLVSELPLASPCGCRPNRSSYEALGLAGAAA